MPTSFVLRLTGSALAVGRLAGEVEDVASGARGQFRDAEELATWCAAALAAVPSPGSARPRVLHASYRR